MIGALKRAGLAFALVTVFVVAAFGADVGPRRALLSGAKPWVLSNAVSDLDFASGRYFGCYSFEACILQNGAASGGYVSNGNGSLTWKYGPVTNTIRNSTAQGAVPGSPGTMPTDWSDNTPSNGITRQIISSSTVNGIEGVTLRYTGTAATSFTVNVQMLNSVQVAALGQYWVYSVYLAGTINSGSAPVWSAELDELSTGTFLAGSQAPGFAVTSTPTQFNLQRLLSQATVNQARGYTRLALTSGLTYDFMVFVGRPQFENASAYANAPLPSPAIATSGTATTSTAPLPIGTGTGLRAWEARTNIGLQSNFQSLTPWTVGTVTVAQNTSDFTAPDGSSTALKLTSPTGNQSIYQGAIPVTASSTYTLSYYMRLGTMPLSDFRLAIYNETASTFIATDIPVSYSPAANGWYRATYTFATQASQTALRVYPFRFLAVTGGTAYLWCVQVELGASASDCIPTAATAQTRNFDNLVATGPLATSLLAANGYYVMAGSTLPDVAVLRRTIQLGATFYTSFNSTQFGTSTPLLAISGGASPAAAPWKAGYGWTGNNGSVVLNNGTVTAGAASRSAVASPVTFGDVGDGTRALNTYARRLTVFPAQNDAQMKAFTVNWLLKRDIDPAAANDNDPMWLEKAA